MSQVETRCGSVVGVYQLERAIGEGGMGAVYVARHVELGHRVAIKFLHAEAAVNEDVARRFAMEARLTANLRHPNIVRVLDVVRDDQGETGIVMEWLEGETFAEMLARESPLTETQTADVLLPVMEALAYAHEQGVVHRDLKPENIFLVKGPNGVTPTVVDFGIAKVAQSKTYATQTGVVFGTPAYMSPEQARGLSKQVNEQTDVWSIGAIWFEALTGRTPLLSDTPMGMLAAILTEDAPRLNTLGVNALCADAVERALSRDQERRYPSMAAFRSALVGASPVVLPTDTPKSDTESKSVDAPPHTKNSTWVVVAAVFSVAIAMLAVALVVTDTSSEQAPLADVSSENTSEADESVTARTDEEAFVADLPLGVEQAGETSSGDPAPVEPAQVARAGAAPARRPGAEAEQAPVGSADATRTATMRSPLDGAAVRGVVGAAENRVMLQRCYNTAIRDDAAPSSIRVDIRIRVAASGSVTRATATGENLGPLKGCLEASVRRWTFPESTSGGEAAFPVVFSAPEPATTDSAIDDLLRGALNGGSMSSAEMHTAATNTPTADREHATVNINTRPWSEIYVDGRRVGNTPQRALSLSAGSHRIRFVNPEFNISETISVTLEPGENRQILRNFPTP